MVNNRLKQLGDVEATVKAKEVEHNVCDLAVKGAEQMLAKHETQMTESGLMRFSSSPQQCALCCDDVEVGKAVKLGCSHGWYCPDCITRFVEARLDSGTAGQVPCPDCKTGISEEVLVRLLPSSTVFKLHARSIEKAAVAAGAVQRCCPTPNCAMRQTFKDTDKGQLTCVMCSKESCWLCGVQPYHHGMTCEQHAAKKRKASDADENDALFMKWMEDTGTRQCPTCKMATTKENLAKQSEQRSECHKMLCRNCGTKFCFKCLAVLTDTYTCGCTKNKHGFIDPFSGEIVDHLKRGAAKRAKV